MPRFYPALAVTLICLLTTALWAQPPRLSEYRLGVEWHDVPLLSWHVEPGLDLSGQILFHSFGFLNRLKAPRPELGFAVNTCGRTSQFHAGVVWSVPLPKKLEGGLFVGGAVHSGKLAASMGDWRSLGTRCLFRWGGEVGWRLTPRLSVLAAFSHVSNSGLGDRNDGMNSLGFFFGYRPSVRRPAD